MSGIHYGLVHAVEHPLMNVNTLCLWLILNAINTLKYLNQYWTYVNQDHLFQKQLKLVRYLEVSAVEILIIYPSVMYT